MSAGKSSPAACGPRPPRRPLRSDVTLTPVLTSKSAASRRARRHSSAASTPESASNSTGPSAIPGNRRVAAPGCSAVEGRTGRLQGGGDGSDFVAEGHLAGHVKQRSARRASSSAHSARPAGPSPRRAGRGIPAGRSGRRPWSRTARGQRLRRFEDDHGRAPPCQRPCRGEPEQAGPDDDTIGGRRHGDHTDRRPSRPPRPSRGTRRYARRRSTSGRWTCRRVAGAAARRTHPPPWPTTILCRAR